MKLKQKLFQSPFGFVQRERSEVKGHPRELWSEERPQGILGENDDWQFPTLMILIWREARYPNEFLGWLHTIERIFEYKEMLNDKKVKLVALGLQNCFIMID